MGSYQRVSQLLICVCDLALNDAMIDLMSFTVLQSWLFNKNSRWQQSDVMLNSTGSSFEHKFWYRMTSLQIWLKDR